MVDEAWSLLAHRALFAAELAVLGARDAQAQGGAGARDAEPRRPRRRATTQVIFDQIGNRIYLPHAEAMRPQTRALYEAAGLTAEQIQLCRAAQPKGEYLLQTEELTRLVSLRLEGDALRAVRRVHAGRPSRGRGRCWARGVRPGEEFTRAWLAQTTAEWLAEQGVAPCTRRSRGGRIAVDPPSDAPPRGARAPRLALLRLRPAVPRRRRVAAQRGRGSPATGRTTSRRCATAVAWWRWSARARRPPGTSSTSASPASRGGACRSWRRRTA